MKKYALIIILIFFQMLIGCSYFQGYIDIAKYRGTSQDYENTLKKWTREKTVHSQFETRVHISATYKSAEFNSGYQKEYARIYNSKDKENNEKEIAPVAEYKEFLFYAYIPEKDSNDFELQRSIWKIYLLNENGERIDPVEIRRITKITPVIEVFYPYINKYYGYCYQLKFPNKINLQNNAVNSENKPIKLLFTSVLGKVELAWD